MAYFYWNGAFPNGPLLFIGRRPKEQEENGKEKVAFERERERGFSQCPFFFPISILFARERERSYI